LLDAARDQPAGTKLVVDGTAYDIVQHGTGRHRRLLARRQSDGELFDPVFEETEAFWAWAAIEVVRLSGLRIEEVMELTHLSIRRYTQPDGQVVPLLQVAPSKIDVERVFPISPELSHVFAQIIEWAEFERHFTLRKVAYGNCDRPYGSPCAHEHACVRCPMLRPEPSRLPLLRELESNLTERIAEARDRVWLGEVAGLQETLAALRTKTSTPNVSTRPASPTPRSR
jgi:hypothetical protein